MVLHDAKYFEVLGYLEIIIDCIRSEDEYLFFNGVKHYLSSFYVVLTQRTWMGVG